MRCILVRVADAGLHLSDERLGPSPDLHALHHAPCAFPIKGLVLHPALFGKPGGVIPPHLGLAPLPEPVVDAKLPQVLNHHILLPVSLVVWRRDSCVRAVSAPPDALFRAILSGVKREPVAGPDLEVRGELGVALGLELDLEGRAPALELRLLLARLAAPVIRGGPQLPLHPPVRVRNGLLPIHLEDYCAAGAEHPAQVVAELLGDQRGGDPNLGDEFLNRWVVPRGGHGDQGLGLCVRYDHGGRSCPLGVVGLLHEEALPSGEQEDHWRVTVHPLRLVVFVLKALAPVPVVLWGQDPAGERSPVERGAKVSNGTLVLARYIRRLQNPYRVRLDAEQTLGESAGGAQRQQEDNGNRGCQAGALHPDQMFSDEDVGW